MDMATSNGLYIFLRASSQAERRLQRGSILIFSSIISILRDVMFLYVSRSKRRHISCQSITFDFDTTYTYFFLPNHYNLLSLCCPIRVRLSASLLLSIAFTLFLFFWSRLILLTKQGFANFLLCFYELLLYDPQVFQGDFRIVTLFIY